MDCEQARGLLSEYVDDMLSPDLRGELEVHLDGCDRCARELVALRTVLRAMHELPRVSAPPGFVHAINRRLDSRPTWRQRIAEALGPLFRGAPLRVAALVTSVLVVFLVYRQMPPRDHMSEIPAPHPSATLEKPVGSGTASLSEPPPTPAPHAAVSSGEEQEGATGRHGESGRGSRDKQASPGSEPVAVAPGVPDVSPSPPLPVPKSRSSPPAPAPAIPSPHEGPARPNADDSTGRFRQQASVTRGSRTPPELVVVLSGTRGDSEPPMDSAGRIPARPSPSEPSRREAASMKGTHPKADVLHQKSAPVPGEARSAAAPPQETADPAAHGKAGAPASPSLEPRSQLQSYDRPSAAQPLRSDESRPTTAGGRTESEINQSPPGPWKPSSQPNRIDSAVASLRRILAPLSGSILNVEHTGDPPSSASVTLRIPARSYPRLVRQIQALGTIQSGLSDKAPPADQDPLTVRITLLAR